MVLHSNSLSHSVEALEDRFCLSASPVAIAAPEPAETIVVSTIKSESTTPTIEMAADLSKLDVQAEDSGSTSDSGDSHELLPAAGLEVVVAATSTINRGSGNDIVVAGATTDPQMGSDGADVLRGGAGNDTFFVMLGSENAGQGNPGSSGDGADVLRGGAGSDAQASEGESLSPILMVISNQD